MVAYVKDLVAKEGPQAIAANAHKIVQYTLSKVPANLLYWFTSKVLNLPSEVAMKTTEFLKSRTEIECVEQTPLQIRLDGSGEGRPALMGRSPSTSDIERRLERLEMDYQVLQERHHESMKMLTCKPEDMYLPVCLYFALVSCATLQNIALTDVPPNRENSPCPTANSYKSRHHRGKRKSHPPRNSSDWTHNRQPLPNQTLAKWMARLCSRMSDSVRCHPTSKFIVLLLP